MRVCVCVCVFVCAKWHVKSTNVDLITKVIRIYILWGPCLPLQSIQRVMRLSVTGVVLITSLEVRNPGSHRLNPGGPPWPLYRRPLLLNCFGGVKLQVKYC